VSGEITGWQQQRITAHIAQALVHLGDTGEARRISQDLAAADGQYGGQAAATIALGEAAEEGIDKSMESLDKMKSDADFETAWWRTVGYVSLARRPAVSRAEKTKALAAAYESAQTISGWKRAEALESIASEYHELGEKRQALEALRAAEAIVAPLPDTLPVKAVLMSNLARAWTGLGHDAHARDLLAQAAALVPSAPLVDRPGAYANVASSYLELKDKRESARSYDRALAEAESLVNARPRALAVVDVCRAMGRNRVDLEPATRARLDRLLEGLSEPW